MAVYPSQITLTNAGFETTGGWTGTGDISFSGQYIDAAAQAIVKAAYGDQFLLLHTGNLPDTELRAWQDVAVDSGFYSDIDAGKLSATIRCQWTVVSGGAFGSYRGWLEIGYYDSDDLLIANYVGSDFTIDASPNDYPTDDIGFYQVWRPQQYTHTVPAGTRTIRVTLGGADGSNTPCGSMFDAVELEVFDNTDPRIIVEQAYTEFLGAVDSAAQVLQEYVEVIEDGNPSNVSVPQVYAEALVVSPSPAEVSQVYAEAMVASPSDALVAQVYAEVVRSVSSPSVGGGGSAVIVVIMM